MFNIIKTPRNYILHANYYTTVMWHFTAKSRWRPYSEESCSGKYSAGPVLPLCSYPGQLSLAVSSWVGAMSTG